MLFSIVVPVYNVEKYLQECLDSIIKQILQMSEACEIILVDDGSTDSSGKICDRYKTMYPDIIRVFHNSNHGLLMTRRFGYKMAIGEYIVNCDSDDLLELDFFKTLVKTIREYSRPDMIMFNQYLYDGWNKKVAFDNILSEKDVSVVPKQDVLRQFLMGNSLVSICGATYKRTCIDINKDYSMYAHVSNGEDSLQKIELFDHADTFVYLNKALYNYRMGSGMTTKFDANYYSSFKVVFKEIIRRKEKWSLSDFEYLLSIKVLSTVGRAITQTRLKKWKNYKDHKKYLQRIREDDILTEYIENVDMIKRQIQKSHLIFLILLKKYLYCMIIVLLNLKNLSEKIGMEK